MRQCLATLPELATRPELATLPELAILSELATLLELFAFEGEGGDLVVAELGVGMWRTIYCDGRVESLIGSRA